MSVFLKQIESIIHNYGPLDSFYIADESEINLVYSKWMQYLPRIDPYYSISCNDNNKLIECLSKLDRIGFSCSSSQHLKLALSQGLLPENILYSNPSKSLTHLNFAKTHGINIMPFDSESELLKLSTIYPEAQLLIRIATKDFDSSNFRPMFGVSVVEAESLLEKAKSLSMKIVGVSFDVGSEVITPGNFRSALRKCRHVAEFARDLEMELSVLDIGGGFNPHFEGEEFDSGVAFERQSSFINDCLEEFFPEAEFQRDKFRVIAEPGRFFAQRAFTLCLCIHGKKVLNQGEIVTIEENDVEKERIAYYVSEGIFSAFRANFMQKVRPSFWGFYSKGEFIKFNDMTGQLFETIIWGPTCDGADKVLSDIKILELNVGDWLIFDFMGAYSLTVSTDFNGFGSTEVFWINSNI